jgi:hypothetical protein
MKKFYILLLLLLPMSLLGQYVSHPVHYPSDSISKIIIKGNSLHLFEDTVVLVDSRKNKDVSTTLHRVKALNKIKKEMSKGNPVYGGRTNGGFSFSIYIEALNDEMNILRIMSFKVSQETGRIHTVIFYPGG